MTNKNTFILLILSLAALLPAGAQAQSFPIRISSLEGLRKIGNVPDYPLHATYELMNDIDASPTRAAPFEPIGDNIRPFTGRFYGAGGNVFVIRNIYINKPRNGHVGLFGVIGYGASIESVGVLADTILGNYAVGALAGTNNGTITNCFGEGVVIATRAESNAGGLVGVNSGSVSRSYATASVDGWENVGGLVGLQRISAAGEIVESFAIGDVRGSDFVGGLVGQIFGGRVHDCFSAGKVSGKSSRSVLGGLVGKDFGGSLSWSDRGTFEVGDVSYYVEAANVSASFWDVGASGQGASAAGAGRSTAAMMSRGTFTGWDFGGVWGIAEGEHYPQLAGIPMYTHTIAYSVDNEECGMLRVSQGGGGYVDLYSYTMAVMQGMPGFEVVALPFEGCRFLGWSDGSSSARRVDIAVADAAFTASFLPDSAAAHTRVYRYAATEGGALRVGGVSGLVAALDTAVSSVRGPHVAAVALSGYRFHGWSDGSADVVRSDTAAGDLALTALFLTDGAAFFKVSSYGDLYMIGRYSAYPLNGRYELVSDIDMSVSALFEPIGAPDAPFTGVFRGNGYKLTGLSVSRADDGFAGLFAHVENAMICGVHIEADVSGGQYVGALAGMCVNSVIDSCSVAGSVRGVSDVGGLIGRSVNSLISRAYSTASVDATRSNAGGLVGSGAASFIAESYSGGVVDASEYVGGFAGQLFGGHAQHAYSAGSVSGFGRVGGFVGEALGNASVLQSYSSAAVVGVGVDVGGFSGTLSEGGAQVSGCYWDVQRSGKPMSAGAAGRTSAEMAMRGTYVGWDFGGVWGIDDGVGYPWLRGLVPESQPEVFLGPVHPPAAAAIAKAHPLIRVTGRIMHVNAPKDAKTQIRIIDTRGRVIAKYSTAGRARIALNKIPSGSYIVEAVSHGRRASVSSIRIIK